jgi:hypothetical protein
MTRQATRLVMTYDEAGNASFKSEVITNTRSAGSAKVFNIGEAINRFQFDSSPSTEQTELVSDPLADTLIKIKKFIMNEPDQDDDQSLDIVKVKEFDQFDIKDVVTQNIYKALGESKGDKYSKYTTIADATNIFKTVNKGARTSKNLGLTTAAINPFVSLTATGLNKYSEYQRNNIISEYFDSDYYKDKMNTMQTEYETYGDYDAFTDYNAGPTYTREDLKPGTVFDADTDPADEGEQPTTTTGIMSPPSHIGPQSDNGSDDSSSQDTASTAGDAPGYSGPSPF